MRFDPSIVTVKQWPTFTVWNKQQKSHLLSQNVFLQSINYPSEKKIPWNKQHFGMSSSRVLPTLSSCYAKQPWRKLVSGFSFACNKYPPQFTDDKSNDSSIREGIPLDALNWFGRGYELHTPKSVGREGWKAWALSVVPHFSLSPPRVAFSRMGWFSHALTFRSLYYPLGKTGDYS